MAIRPLMLTGHRLGKFKTTPQLPGVASKHLGALAELMACEWLMRQGYEVFRNISSHGLADYVAWRPGETPRLIDVKSNFAGKPTTAQQAAGVEILYVDRDRRVFSFDRDDLRHPARLNARPEPRPPEDARTSTD